MRSGIRSGCVFGSGVDWMGVVCRRRVDVCTANDSPPQHP